MLLKLCMVDTILGQCSPREGRHAWVAQILWEQYNSFRSQTSLNASIYKPRLTGMQPRPTTPPCRVSQQRITGDGKHVLLQCCPRSRQAAVRNWLPSRGQWPLWGYSPGQYYRLIPGGFLVIQGGQELKSHLPIYSQRTSGG